jgi:flagellar biosynthetic protein FlhB
MAEEADDDDKTEEPSQRKLERALERGDVAKSQEVGVLFLLAATLAVMMLIAGPAAHALVGPMSVLIGEADQFRLDGGQVGALWWAIGKIFALCVLVPGALMAAAAVAGNLVQHRFVLSAESLKPKLSKISPIAGFKRLFGFDAIVNFIKGLVKITAVVVALVLVLWPMRGRLDQWVGADLATLMPIMKDIAERMLIAVLILMAFIAGFDFLFQRQRYLRRQRMTQKEIKDEYKETEGNPEVKAKIKQLRSRRAQRRMMAEVPKATVVITNPTHFAVALRYDDETPAPVCVAKGVDQIALKIREVAREAGVPIVENPPLARALHASVDLDDRIPEAHYRAVAEVIGFVMRLKRRRVGV